MSNDNSNEQFLNSGLQEINIDTCILLYMYTIKIFIVFLLFIII